MPGTIVTPEEAAARRREREAAAAAQPLPSICTRYDFVKALKALGLYEQIYEAWKSSDELQFYWGTVNELNRDNEDFRRLAASLGATEEQLDAIFRMVKEIS